MTFEEIDAAIASGRTSDIEDAFKALVEYPGYGGRIAGATQARLPARLAATLAAVCDALLEDERIMPGGTLDAIKGTIPDETELVGGTYSHGASTVKRHMARFARA
jgi:hypothetical protein